MPAAGEDAAGGAVPGHHLQPPAVLRRGAVPADEREETHLDVPRVRPRGALRPPHHRRVSVTPRPPPDPTPHAPRRAGAAPPEPPQPCSPGRLFMEILNSCTDCDEIEFMEDGSWCPMQHRKEKRELCGAADLGGSGGLGWGGGGSCAEMSELGGGERAVGALLWGWGGDWGGDDVGSGVGGGWGLGGG